MSGERSTAGGSRPLSLEEYKRYGRQMIMPGWGLEGQVKVKAAKVAVVGAGGLGCPLLQYLAGAGVGTIGIFDHDEVDVSNLHRQVLHSSRSVGRNKAESAAEACRALNPHIEILPHAEAIDQHNAIELLESFDIVVDCTDRPLTRYLLSDASVLLSKTLVSGAAISTVGQWAVYGGISGKGKQRACYRCMWPSIIGDGGGRCDELGVWGSTVGLVGVAMAGEVLKVILGQDGDPLLHLYNQSGDPLVRTIRVRPPSAKCIACGPNRTITSLADFDYVSFCSGPKAESSSAETSCKRINPKDLDELLRGESDNRVVIDTRPPEEYGICSLPNTINMPFADILKKPEEVPTANEVYFVCRRGNDSLVAANALRVHFDKSGKNGPTVSDVRGGLVAWSKEVDPEFPVY